MQGTIRAFKQGWDIAAICPLSSATAFATFRKLYHHEISPLILSLSMIIQRPCFRLVYAFRTAFVSQFLRRFCFVVEKIMSSGCHTFYCLLCSSRRDRKWKRRRRRSLHFRYCSMAIFGAIYF